MARFSDAQARELLSEFDPSEAELVGPGVSSAGGLSPGGSSPGGSGGPLPDGLSPGGLSPDGSLPGGSGGPLSGGFGFGDFVGEGMEGAVYSVGPGQVAKIWFSQPISAVRATMPFFDALAAKGLPFATPQIFDVREIDGYTVSRERRLLGTPMTAKPGSQQPFVAAVAALAGSGRCPEARSLTIMDETEPFWSGGDAFGGALAALASRRRRRFGTVLAAAVDDFDRVADALIARLPQVDSGVRTAIHGDLVPANLLVSPESTVVAVLDWGFFSTEGDPVFEAAVAAALFDMYGDDAVETELGLYEHFEKALGYARADLLVYRAAYSLITANVFSPEGRDGHFAWCARALNRPDVRRALLL